MNEKVATGITEQEAKRLVEWVVNQGMGKEKAYEALAYTLNATVDQLEEGKSKPVKKYKLLGADGQIYESEVPGTFGGNGKMKIYGRFDCPSANSTIRRFPGKYEKHRVFFADEKTALAAGYRPCGNCLREKYKEYMEDPEAYKAKFGLSEADKTQ